MSLAESVPRSLALRGQVKSLHRKPETGREHGLPKPNVPEIQVGPGGVAGDFNRYRHEEQQDEPDQAILLMPAEMIAQLNREGWPIQEGDVGENVTSEGIPYDEFRPGDRFRVGDAIVEISKPCVPCDNLYLLPYVGASKGPRFLKTMLDRRGWYGRVTQAGRVRTGDVIARL